MRRAPVKFHSAARQNTSFRVKRGAARALLVIVTSVIIGWVTVPSAALAQAPWVVHAKYDFHLTQGQGVAVCDAFLRRLQITKFTNPPYCGIPETDAVPGFSPLHRVLLAKSKIVDLFPKVFSFTYKQNQGVVPPESSSADIRGYVEHDEVSAWKYSPQISIENNGKSDNVVVWQGSGIFNAGNVRCGQVISAVDPPDGARSPQIALILSDDDLRIDQRRTVDLLGNPGKSPQLFPGFRNLSSREFVPLGTQMGFFLYRSIYYIYAFDGALLRQRRAPDTVPDSEAAQVRQRLLNTLVVFVHDDVKIRRLCEYRMRIQRSAGY